MQTIHRQTHGLISHSAVTLSVYHIFFGFARLPCIFIKKYAKRPTPLCKAACNAQAEVSFSPLFSSVLSSIVLKDKSGAVKNTLFYSPAKIPVSSRYFDAILVGFALDWQLGRCKSSKLLHLRYFAVMLRQGRPQNSRTEYTVYTCTARSPPHPSEDWAVPLCVPHRPAGLSTD